MKITISVLPLAIRLARWNKKSLIKTINKWKARLDTTESVRGKEILNEGIAHFTQRVVDLNESIVEMTLRHKANKLIEW